MKNRIGRWIILLFVGFGIGSGIGYYQAQNELDDGVIALSPDAQSLNATILKKPKSKISTNAPVGSSDIGGAFSLIDHNGKAVTEADYSNSYKLVFFGFSYCPAVCPTELQKVAAVMDQLGERAAEVIPIFISVDPERDTADVMKKYVEQFHPSLVGLTGSMKQIEGVKDAYKVFATKVENDMMDEYMMDHSAFLYFMDKENKMIALYPSKDTAANIATDIQERFE